MLLFWPVCCERWLQRSRVLGLAQLLCLVKEALFTALTSISEGGNLGDACFDKT